MKFAIVDGEKREATKRIAGRCPVCGSDLLAKCGDVRIHHWAHKRTNHCDHWWENETEWHRTWKNQFPAEWQEIVHYSNSGEKHVADVKLPDQFVIEFQHSAITPQERESRNAFYKRVIWVVDGLRLKRDLREFTNAISELTSVTADPAIKIVRDPASCAILKKWAECDSPVFYDFSETVESGAQVIWLQLPLPKSQLMLFRLGLRAFVQTAINGQFSLLLEEAARARSRLIGIRQPVLFHPKVPQSSGRIGGRDRSWKKFMHHDKL